MSLLDDLRDVGKFIDTSLLPTSNELSQVLGALLHSHEHPELVDKIREGREAQKSDAEIRDDVGAVISPPPPEPEQPEQPAGGDVDQLRQEVQQLRAQLDAEAAARGSAQRSTVEHQAGGYVGPNT